MILFLAAALPLLYWDAGPETAGALKQAGIDRLAVPAAAAASWKDTGITVVPVSASDLESRVKLAAPRVDYKIDLASATRTPWVTANGWRFVRNPSGKYFYTLPKGTAVLAAAEAFAYGADALLKIDAADLEPAGRMLAFLRSLDSENFEPQTELTVVDDGSPLTGEVMNLLARRNLLFRAAPAPDPRAAMNVQIGTKEHPKADAANPHEFTLKLRRQIGDDKRLLRIYGSEVVIGRVTASRDRARLHLLNYSNRGLEGLRVRLRGMYAPGPARAPGAENMTVEDYQIVNGTTEFSLPLLETYAVVDLRRQK